MKPSTLALVVLNLFGAVLGFTVYYPQLLATNPLLWIFVPDCPLAALLFILLILGVRNPYFEAFARLYAFKYGVWTIAATLTSPALLAYKYAGLNLLLHAGLIAESFLFMKQKLLPKHFTPALILLLLNDASDYFLNTHPVIENALFTQIMVFTFALSIITTIMFQKIYSKRRITSFSSLQ